MKKKVDNPNVRQTIASALSVFIISLIVFALAYKLSVIPYLTIVACCAGLVCVYARTINVVRLDRTLQTTIAFAANILAFLIIKLVNGRSFRQIPTDRWVAIFILMMIIAAETAYIVHSTRNYAKKDYTEEAYRAGRKESGDRIRFNEDTLLPSRESDYEKLRQLILKNNIVGAEGEWGSGKSYIVDSLTEELKESGFEVVPLKMFELNTDDVVSVFLWTIDNLLRKHGIATRHSRILSRMVDGNKYLADFQNALFPDYESLDSALNSIRESLKSIGHIVIFVIEDIDRLKDSEKVRTVFDLADRLSDDKVRFIMEYDRNALKKLDDSLDYNFLEKYIPVYIPLSPVKLEEAIETLTTGTVDDPAFVTYDEISNIRISAVTSVNHLLSRLGSGISLENRDGYITSIREVKHFLNELYYELVLNKDYYNDKVRRRAIISVLLIKHFSHDLYEGFEKDLSPSRSMYVEVCGKRFTTGMLGRLADLFDKEEKNAHRNHNDSNPDKTHLNDKKIFGEHLDEIIKEDSSDDRPHDMAEDCTNNLAFTVQDDSYYRLSKAVEIFQAFYMLGYEPVPEKYLKNPHAVYEARNKQISEDEEHFLNHWISKEYSNSEIDRVVWHELATGSSEYTDEEAFVRAMKKEVLSKDTFLEQEAAFHRLHNRMWYGHLFKDAGTIDRVGVPMHETMSRAYRAVGASDQDWIRLMDFIENYTLDNRANDRFDISKFETLYVIGSCSDESMLIRAMKLFLAWQADADYTSEQSYRRFIAEYLKRLVYTGLADSGFYYHALDYEEYVGSDGHDYKDILRKTLQEFIDASERRLAEYEKDGSERAVSETATVIRFLQKNKEMTTNTRRYKEPSHISTSFSTGEYPHKNPDLYKSLEQDPDSDKINEAFDSGKIDIREYNTLRLRTKT